MSQSKNPLHYAVKDKNLEMVQKLIDSDRALVFSKAEIEEYENIFILPGDLPIHVACRIYNSGVSGADVTKEEDAALVQIVNALLRKDQSPTLDKLCYMQPNNDAETAMDILGFLQEQGGKVGKIVKVVGDHYAVAKSYVDLMAENPAGLVHGKSPTGTTDTKAASDDKNAKSKPVEAGSAAAEPTTESGAAAATKATDS